MYPNDGFSGDQLITNADAAMYAPKGIRAATYFSANRRRTGPRPSPDLVATRGTEGVYE